MKTNAHSYSWLFAALLMLMSTATFSQREVTWLGGTPGMKNDWYCPQNWSTSAVPDEFSDVIIPDVSTTSLALPVLGSGRVEINSIFIQSNASLTIEKLATVIVFGNAEGNFQKNLRGEGELMLQDGSSATLKKLVADRSER